MDNLKEIKKLEKKRNKLIGMAKSNFDKGYAVIERRYRKDCQAIDNSVEMKRMQKLLREHREDVKKRGSEFQICETFDEDMKSYPLLEIKDRGTGRKIFCKLDDLKKFMKERRMGI